MSATRFQWDRVLFLAGAAREVTQTRSSSMFSQRTGYRHTRPALAMLMLAALLLTSFATANQAYAGKGTISGRSVCRADPIVWFTDGTMLQMSVSVEADASDVLEIVYVVT